MDKHRERRMFSTKRKGEPLHGAWHNPSSVGVRHRPVGGHPPHTIQRPPPRPAIAPMVYLNGFAYRRVKNVRDAADLADLLADAPAAPMLAIEQTLSFRAGDTRLSRQARFDADRYLGGRVGDLDGNPSGGRRCHGTKRCTYPDAVVVMVRRAPSPEVDQGGRHRARQPCYTTSTVWR